MNAASFKPRLSVALLATALSFPLPVMAETNGLSADEAADGWQLLFDGNSLEHWRGFKMEELPAGWKVEDGTIVFAPPESGTRGDIVTKEQFENFELVVEWAVTPAGNSGIFFRVSEDASRTYSTGPEFQILDNGGHRDGQRAETSAAANYALHAATSDVTRPVGEFNEARLRVDGDQVTHWLNGEKVVEYRLWTDEWKAMVAASKFASMPGYGLNKRGHIALQDHGDLVRFRNVKVRRLP
ncbi:MAG: DUF1080 domain-containing protein [Acidobacteriota bacterium]